MRKKQKQAETAAPLPEQKRITPVDIQQKEFRLAMRGYNERDVDQFLDEVTEEVARLYADNKRLREEVEFSKTTRLETTGAAEAEGLIRQAREESARIVAEATARASTLGATDASGHSGAGTDPQAGAPPSEIMGIFLARERAFLQNMANLIQAHAEGVKQDVRRVREVARHVPPAQPPSDAQATAEEPTRAWEAVRDEQPSKPDPSSGDIVDLTERQDEEAEAGAAGAAAEASGNASEAEAALSGVYGRTTPPSGGSNAPRLQREATAGPSTAPGVEDDDATEDRSIRELFWGED